MARCFSELHSQLIAADTKSTAMCIATLIFISWLFWPRLPQHQLCLMVPVTAYWLYGECATEPGCVLSKLINEGHEIPFVLKHAIITQTSHWDSSQSVKRDASRQPVGLRHNGCCEFPQLKKYSQPRRSTDTSDSGHFGTVRTLRH